MSNLIADLSTENPKKRLKLNSNIVFVIQKINSIEKATLEFSEEKYEIISSKSEYIKTLLDQYSDLKSSNESKNNTIYLTEEEPNEAAAFLTVLSKPIKNEIWWDKYYCNLSAKWIVPKYIEKYIDSIKDFFQKYESCEKNLMVTLLADNAIDSTTNRYFYIEGKYLNCSTIFTKAHFFKNSKNLWCYKDNEGTIYIQEQLNNNILTDLCQMTGTWKTEKEYGKIYYQTFVFKMCPPIVTNSDDLIKFCEIIELILTHECYHNKYILSMNDLYDYLSQNVQFATENNLNRLFQTNEQFKECLLAVLLKQKIR